jgi:glycosyltransferase involved in cell wall biosynthesis
MSSAAATSAPTPADAPAKRPQVSIVIPNYNYGRFLPGCLDSITRQSMDTRDIEVIFVDDASSDGSVELARALLAAMPLAGYRILSLPHTGRPGPVRNAGLTEARGQTLLPLDPDDALMPDFLPRCLDALGQGADVAYTDYLVDDHGQTREVRLVEYNKLLLANQNIVSPTALFRREFWDRGIRFRSETTYEDWDFWIQLALAKARFVHVEEPLYLYRIHGANFSNMATKRDAASKALLVRDNAAFFPSWTLTWAKGVLRGAPWADPMPRGIIPVLPEQTPCPPGK